MNNRNEIIQKSLYALDHMKNFTEFAWAGFRLE